MSLKKEIAAAGLVATVGFVALGAPVASAHDETPQPIIVPGEMQSLKGPILIQTSLPELSGNQEAIKPDFELFRRIIDASINQNLLGSFLERIHEDLSENPEEHFSFRQELGGPGFANHLIYTHPDLELTITDPGGNENYLGQFIIVMQLHKSINITVDDDSSGIVEPTLNLFTGYEQMVALEFFNAPGKLREKEWISRQRIAPDGPPGVFRGYSDENNMLHAQDATIEGLISYTGVYKLSETPNLTGSGNSGGTLIQVQP